MVRALYKPRELTGAEVQEWLNEEAIGNPTLGELAHSWDSVSYLKRFEEVQSNIRSGDIYQLNLTFKAKFKLEGSPLALYRDLRLKQRVAYAGLVDTGDVTILSASPELFIKQEGRVIETRPMKGTAPRAGTLEADAEVRHALSKDVKNRAENLMIVDLMRNDLGRIADLGSVSVTDLFTVETFKTLHQMTSGVRARLKSRHRPRRYSEGDLSSGLGDRRAQNPRDGTDPRTRDGSARRLLRRHRPLFAGWSALFNVAIRTAVIDRQGAGEMGSARALSPTRTASKSMPSVLLKMKFLTDPVRRFELIETMLYEPGERHLAQGLPSGPAVGVRDLFRFCVRCREGARRDRCSDRNQSE